MPDPIIQTILRTVVNTAFDRVFERRGFLADLRDPALRAELTEQLDIALRAVDPDDQVTGEIVGDIDGKPLRQADIIDVPDQCPECAGLDNQHDPLCSRARCGAMVDSTYACILPKDHEGEHST